MTTDGPSRTDPGTVQRYQWKLIGLVTGIQPEDVTATLAECARRLGRPVPTRGALSYNDAKAIIEWKEPAGERDERAERLQG